MDDFADAKARASYKGFVEAMKVAREMMPGRLLLTTRRRTGR